MGKYKNLGVNTILVFIGNASSKIIGLVMLPFYTRHLTVDEYGISDIVVVYVSLLLGLCSCCIHDAIFVFPKGKSLKEQKRYFSSGLSFVAFSGIISAIILYSLFHLFNYLKILDSFVDNVFYIYSLLICQIILNYVQQFSRSINKILHYSLTGIVLTGFTALLAFLLIPRLHLDGFFLSLIIAYIFAIIYCLISVRAFWMISLSEIHFPYLKELLTYSIPLIPNGIMWWLVSSVNRPILERFTNYHEIGLLAVADKFPGILSMLFTVFITSWQISVMEEFGKEGYKRFYNSVFCVVFVGSSLLLTIITVMSKALISVFATEEYIMAWKLIPILTMSVLFQNVGGVVGCNFSATKESKYYFYSSVWSGGAAVLLNLLLIPQYGIFGASFATLLAMLAMAVSRCYYSWKYVAIDNIPGLLMLALANIVEYLILLMTGSVFFLTIAVICHIILCYFLTHHILHRLLFKILRR